MERAVPTTVGGGFAGFEFNVSSSHSDTPNSASTQYDPDVQKLWSASTSVGGRLAVAQPVSLPPEHDLTAPIFGSGAARFGPTTTGHNG